MKVKASSFADPDDVTAFRKCKARGKTDRECFKIGCNGIGYWGDDTTTNEPCCALSRRHLVERWGSVKAGHDKLVKVKVKGREVVCAVRDIMPEKCYNKRIDLNPGAMMKLNLVPPFLVDAEWEWVDDKTNHA